MFNTSKGLLLSIFFLLCVFMFPPLSEAINVENIATDLGKNRWRWTIFIAEDETILSQIECVEYTLHPTFPNPNQRVCDQRTNFAFTAIGWGTFTISGRVFYKNNRIKQFNHNLVFQKQKTPRQMQIKTKNWSKEKESGWWEWGVSLTADDHVLDSIRCVVYSLHKTFRNPIRIKCDRTNKFELKAKGWGTFRMPVEVLFKDGSILQLNHKLIFKK